ADGAPDDNGTLQIAGKCLSIGSGTNVVLGNCNGALKELWGYLGGGALFNLQTGGCLTDPSESSGVQATAGTCTFDPTQIWNLPDGRLIEGAGALCPDTPGGSQVKATPCHFNSDPRQLWSLEGDFTIRDSSGQCLAAHGLLSATAVTVEPCDANNNSQV